MAGVLLVEPDVRLAAMYAAGLRTQGHKVVARTTAQDAITAADADANPPDIVLLELQLVAHSGIEFLYEFRSYADWQDTPVIIVSHVPPAEFAASHKLLRYRLGVQAYLYKSQMTLKALLAAVARELAVARTVPAGVLPPVQGSVGRSV